MSAEREQLAWAVQVPLNDGSLIFASFMCFPQLYKDWMAAADDDPDYPSPSPSVQLFRFKREAKAAIKDMEIFRRAKIVRVKVTVETVK